ncbi:VWA domain-containing protein [Patescibacteria group bacterium]|nr:VWA domain-containing protein [Patescibacteria group bacterium]
MNKFFIIFIQTVLTMFSANSIRAEDSTALIVIAADQSESMFQSEHSDIQREALITAFANYIVDCNNLQVDYIAWGATTAEPVSARLFNQAAVVDYAQALWPVSHRILETTNHSLGLQAAINQLTASSAQKKVLIFTTDGVSNEPTNWGLGRTIPSDIKVFTISLGSKEISDFVVKNIQPAAGGVHFHANNADELTAKLEEAFAAAKTDLCLS